MNGGPFEGVDDGRRRESKLETKRRQLVASSLAPMVTDVTVTLCHI